MNLVWLIVLVTAAALGGSALLVWAGLEVREAWAWGRTAGPVAVVFPAWWAGSVGVPGWWWIGAVMLALGAAAGLWCATRRDGWLRAVGPPEIVFWAAALSVLVIRLGRPAIIETEKLMDLGILTTLTRAEAFPPPDMWLSGLSLPYYYWGSLLWALPLRLSGLDPAVGYNVIVALVAGASAAGLWALGARLADGRWSAGWPAAFFGVFAGTVDGLWQTLSGFGPMQLDLWASSRQIEGAITEFPLFTFWLGDLHPHLLSVPLAVAAIGVALHAGVRFPARRAVAVAAVLFGATWAANPWALPPTAAAVGLMLLCGDGRWRWPWTGGGGRWLAVAVVAVVGWVAMAPFHLAFDPPAHPIRAVFAWTAPSDLLLFAGGLLVPAFFAVFGSFRDWTRERGSRVILAGAASATLIVVIGGWTGRWTLAGLVIALAAGAVPFFRDGHWEVRPAMALTLLGLFLFLIPEVLYLQDGYGDHLHRMNTIFKAYFQAWIVLAAALPALIRLGGRGDLGRRLLLAGATVAALPHLVGLAASAAVAPNRGLDGFTWMSADDRAIVEILRESPPGTRIIEAVGGAYSHFGRLSASSGTSAYLGWANHELVWRGPEIVPETGRRATLVQAVYSSDDPDEVRALVREAAVDAVAIGALEQVEFEPNALAVVRSAGDRVTPCGDDGFLVWFGRESRVE